jgi:hypothetical protein
MNENLKKKGIRLEELERKVEEIDKMVNSLMEDTLISQALGMQDEWDKDSISLMGLKPSHHEASTSNTSAGLNNINHTSRNIQLQSHTFTTTLESPNTHPHINFNSSSQFNYQSKENPNFNKPNQKTNNVVSLDKKCLSCTADPAVNSSYLLNLIIIFY